MKNLLVLMLSLVLLMSCVGCGEKKNEEGNSTLKKNTASINEAKQEKFTDHTLLLERFMEYCENGNVEGMYSLYYDDMLTKTFEKNSGDLSKEEFDKGLKAQMQSIVYYEEFAYGGEEMLALNSPLSYINQLLYYAGVAELLQVTEEQVSDCVDVRVYKADGGYPSDHMLACIDGYWYFVL